MGKGMGVFVMRQKIGPYRYRVSRACMGEGVKKEEKNQK